MRKGQNKERLGFCELCNRVELVIIFKGKPTCLECLVEDAEPLTIDQFIYKNEGRNFYNENFVYQ